MRTKVINLTPHAINFVQGGKTTPIPSDGRIARLDKTIQQVDQIQLENGVTIPLMQKKIVKLRNLPAPESGTYYIVSLQVAQIAWEMGRKDVLATGEPIRDGTQVIGCSSLIVAPIYEHEKKDSNKKDSSKTKKVITADEIRKFIDNLLQEAKSRDQESLTLVSGDIHRQLGLDKLLTNNRIPLVCSVMKQKLKQYGGEILHTTPSGLGRTIKIKYYLK